MTSQCKDEGKNIVQVEFFHANVNPDVDTLSEALVELAGSMGRLVAAGKPLKTAIRFYDEHGHITKLVKDYCETQSAYVTAVGELAKAELGARFMLSTQKTLLSAHRKMDALRGQAKSLIPGQLSAITKDSKQIAVELPGRFFRMAEEAEFPQLLDNARKAKDLWLFVFTPADLLKVDGLVSVGSITLPLP